MCALLGPKTSHAEILAGLVIILLSTPDAAQPILCRLKNNVKDRIGVNYVATVTKQPKTNDRAVKVRSPCKNVYTRMEKRPYTCVIGFHWIMVIGEDTMNLLIGLLSYQIRHLSSGNNKLSLKKVHKPLSLPQNIDLFRRLCIRQPPMLLIHFNNECEMEFRNFLN